MAGRMRQGPAMAAKDGQNFRRRARGARPLADFIAPGTAEMCGKAGFSAVEIVTHWDELVGAEWHPVSLTVASDRAVELMAVATYTGEGTLCLERVVYEQTMLSQRDWGYLLAGIVTAILLGVGLAYGLAARRRDQ